MAALIKGISVTLYDKIQTGTDGIGNAVFDETPVTVENVLVTPVSSEDAADAVRISGKRAVYELCIPKGDAHIWEDRRVEFYGRIFRTVGYAVEYIEANVPLGWNKKIGVVHDG